MPTWVVASLLVVGGMLVVIRLARGVARDPFLVKVLAGAFGLRVVLTLLLFCVSFFRLPLMPSLQGLPGYWVFGLDCQAYHDRGTKIAVAWENGMELPRVPLGMEYCAVVGVVYKVLGSHPLYPGLINSWLSVLAAFLAYLLGQRLGDQRAARMAAVLVAFWPSSLLWATQLLKDAMIWALILGAVVVILEAMAGGIPRGWYGALRGVLLAVILGLLGVVLARLRLYVVLTLVLSLGIFMGVTVVRALVQRRWPWSLAAAGMILVVLMASGVVGRVGGNLNVTLRAPAPARHFRTALRYAEAREWPQAVAEYQAAIDLKPGYPAAYFGLAVALLQQHRVADGRQAFARYLEHETDPGRRAWIEELIYWKARTPLRQQVWTARVLIGEEPGRELGRAGLLPKGASLWDVHAGFGVAEAAPALPDWAAADVALDGQALPPSPATGVAEAAPALPDSAAAGVVAQVDRVLRTAASEFSPKTLDFRRAGYVGSGGRAQMDTEVRIDSGPRLLAYLPRAFLIGLFAPFPAQWFETGGSTGPMRTISGLEMVLIYFLFPSILAGTWRLVKRPRAEGVFVLTVIVLMMAGLSLAISNMGTLFRLRLQFLMPLLVVAAVGGSPVHVVREVVAWVAWRVRLWPLRPARTTR